MSDADRAARAARAKAMLKKRQREKAGATSTATPNSEIASPNTPSRTTSPVPQDELEEQKRNIGDVFSNHDSDTSWLSSLPRAPSPRRSVQPVLLAQEPATTASPLPLTPEFSVPDGQGVQSHQLHSENLSWSEQVKQLQDSESRLQQDKALLESQQRKLSEQFRVLDSENVSLSAQVKRLQQAETRVQQVQASLDEQHARTKELEDNLLRLGADREHAILNERQTISLLVSEKSSLTAEVERLQDVESRVDTLEVELEEERQNLRAFAEQVQRLQAERQEAIRDIQALLVKEKELNEGYREKERELHLTASSLDDVRQEAEQFKRRLRELEEQIQSDDRVERLENSLKNTQNRADELEFHLSKLKQVHSTLKVERDEIESQRLHQHGVISELQNQLTDLEKTHSEMLEKLSSMTSEKDALIQEKSKASTEGASMHKTLSDLQDKLAEAAATITSDSRQLQTLQSQLKAAMRRADDAERTQQDLQLEGTNLMHSLDEMRPKIVELTSTKLELTETVSSLEHELQNHQDLVSHLDSTLKAVTGEKEGLQQKLNDLTTQHEKDRALALSGSSEVQQAYIELQRKFNETSTRLTDLERERAGHVQEVARRLQEAEALNLTLKQNSDELSALREEVITTQNARDEAHEFLDRTQNELEALRADLSVREDEIAHLREAVNSPTRANGIPSLDNELISSLRQQHALEISAAQSQIRALEHNVFDADARVHSLQKQIGTLENQLTRQRPSSRLGQRSFSPVPSGLRPSSRSSELRRSSFGSHRPGSTIGPLPPLARSILDQNMSAETRHKRLVSLSMLKARMDSEVEVTSRPSSRASSARGLSPVRSVDGSHHDSPQTASDSQMGHLVHRPQFLDDSHVFWCHSCSGDLVIL